MWKIFSQIYYDKKMKETLIRKANNLNKRLNKLMPLITPFAVCCGLLLGDRLASLRSLVTYLFAIMTFFGAMKIGANDIKQTLFHPRFILVYIIVNYLIMPLLAHSIGLICFPSNSDITSGFDLLRAIPTGVVSTIWISILSGSLSGGVTILILDTLLSPILTPFLLKLYTGENIFLDSFGMMKSLFFMVLIPSLLALISNHFYKDKIEKEWGPLSNPVSKILLFLVIAINTSKVSYTLKQNLSFSYVWIFVTSLFISVIAFPVGYYISKISKLKREEIISTTIAISTRNVSAALVLAINYLPPSASLPVIFCIVFQQALCALMGNLLFGEKKVSLK